MAQFELMSIRTTGELVVDCQADLIRHLPTRLVVPLFEFGQGLEPSGRLNPVFTVAERPMIFAPQYMVSIPLAELQPMRTSLAVHDLEMTSAIDIMFSGI